MSRIGKQPIKLPQGVTVNLDGETLVVKGPKGEIRQKFKPEVKIVVEKDLVILEVANKNRFTNSLHGLYRTLIANMVQGVVSGWNKGLELTGVGFRVALSGNQLSFNLGFSHPVVFDLPEGVKVIIKENKIDISGCDKQLVGETAAKIRRIKPPEPYKGKGIHYIGEIIRRKAGKVVKAVGAATGSK